MTVENIPWHVVLRWAVVNKSTFTGPWAFWAILRQRYHHLHHHHHHHHHHQIFLLTCRYMGNIHISATPQPPPLSGSWFVARMAVLTPDLQVYLSWELPLSAIPLCQLLPCHLGPIRPTLSINLYITGCLDCTVGVVHTNGAVFPSGWGPDP